MPVLLVALLWDARGRDVEHRGVWQDYLVLSVLGIVVEFRVFEHARPKGLGSFNRLILQDAALYGFLVIRRLSGVGFHFVPRVSHAKNGLRPESDA